MFRFPGQNLMKAMRGAQAEKISGRRPSSLQIPGAMAEAWRKFSDALPKADDGFPLGMPDMAALGERIRKGVALSPDLPAGHRRAAIADIVPEGGQFAAGSFRNAAGVRPYKLYIPSSYREDGPLLPLIVMLHGCTQDADDFAAGTRMNLYAEQQHFFVVYPEQVKTANSLKCWNWFKPGDQLPEQGEPSLIAGITRQIMKEKKVDSRRVFIAGLSAGGAGAAILAKCYPELYAAVGVHSGLPCGAASDLPSALKAMQHGAQGALAKPGGHLVPTITFHGDRDSTVHPSNAEQIGQQLTAVAGGDLISRRSSGQVPGGHRYDTTSHSDRDGRILLEQWIVHEAGHAWAGGSAAGSYTDQKGPDASREMLRFFFGHPLP